MTGILGSLRTSGPWILAGLLWVMAAAGTFWHVEADLHGLLDILTLAATVAAIVVAAGRHFSGPRLRPGQRIVGPEEAAWMEAAMATAMAAAMRDDGPRNERRLKLV